MGAGYPNDFSVRVEERDDRVIVVARGELDLATAPAFEEVITPPLETGRHVVVDLRELDFMDSSGVRVLVVAHTAAHEMGGRLSVAPGAPGGPIARILEVSGLTDVLDLVGDPEG